MRRFVIPGLLLALLCFSLVFQEGQGAAGPSLQGDKSATERRLTDEKNGKSPPKIKAVQGKLPQTQEARSAPLALPDGAILGLVDNLAEALSQSPYSYLLTPEKYQEMEEEIKRLKALLGPTAPRRPSSCVLRGKVDGNHFQLTAQFEFTTDRANEVIRLGGTQGKATRASLDGRTPMLRRSFEDKADKVRSGVAKKDEPEGFLVEVAKPGQHTLTLDLAVPISGRSSIQGLTLDLPRAAITTVELELPDKSRDVRVAGKPVNETLLTLERNKLTGGLGPVDRLELTWQPVQPAGAGAVLLSDGAVVCRLGERELVTTARLTLRVQSGQVQQWRLVLPPRAEVKLTPEDEQRGYRVDPVDPKQPHQRTISARAASSDPLTVLVTHTQQPPKPGTGKAVSVGPFVVLGTAQNSGSLLICNTVPDWHPEYTPHADLTRRSVTEEEQLREPTCIAAFRYGLGLAANEKVGPATPPSWLDVEVESVRGQIKTRAAHALRLVRWAENGTARAETDRFRWRVQTTLEITPRWADVDRLTVEIPPDCVFLKEESSAPGDRVRSMDQEPMSSRVTIRLNRDGRNERTLTPFTVRIECEFATSVDAKAPGRLAVGLPTPVGTTQLDGSITATVPSGFELVSSEETEGDRMRPLGLELVSRRPQEVRWQYHRKAPATLPLTWQPYRPAVSVSSLVDVTLGATEVRLRHELHYAWQMEKGAPKPALRVRDPGGLINLQCLQGARLVRLGAEPGAPQSVLLDLNESTVGDNKLLVVLEYGYALPAVTSGSPLPLPLVQPLGVMHAQSRVRLWCDPGQLPGPTAGWLSQSTEVVPGRSRLPSLVLRPDRPDRSLSVVLAQDTGLFAFIDRALVRVELSGDGMQRYRVSYRIARLAARSLDLELPAPAPTISFKATLEGANRREVPYGMVQADSADKKGRLVRLVLPEVSGPAQSAGRSVLLEVTYELRPDRMRTSPVSTTLVAPRLLGDEGQIPTRWRVTTPGAWVVLGPEPGTSTPRVWGRRGLLLAPRAIVSAVDLERWLLDADPVTPVDPVAVSLSFWGDAESAVSLSHLPQQVWLLVCSLGLVLIGLLLARLVVNRDGETSVIRVWLSLAGVGVSLALVGLFVPYLGGQIIYGCQPGLVVLLLLAGIQWLLHERYRRQVIFLPSFSRSARPGSSLTRPDSRAEPRSHVSGQSSGSQPLAGGAIPGPSVPGQPSTVDAPRSLGSSINRIA